MSDNVAFCVLGCTIVVSGIGCPVASSGGVTVAPDDNECSRPHLELASASHMNELGIK